MHGLHRDLLEAQAQSLNLSLQCIELDENMDMEKYNQLMTETTEDLKSRGYNHCYFGDINLEDLRAYRDEQLSGVNIQSHYPLWKKDTLELAKEFINLGFRARVVCVNGELLDQSFAGRLFDNSFLADLPKNVDPCGENGEFHTFCFDGPIFSKPVSHEMNEIQTHFYPKPNSSEETPFHFADLRLASPNL